jgi:hypothetical protein
MYSSIKSISIHNILLFEDEPFTKREAWIWLVENSINCQIAYSIRNMASCWKWHRSKVERFINKCKAEGLMETEIRSGKLVITICNSKYFTLSSQKAEASDESFSRQNQDIITSKRQSQDKNGDTQNLEYHASKRNGETKSETQKEEEKKSSKRKEQEKQKEKNTPYRGLKKEKETFVDGKKRSVNVQDATIEHIQPWADTNLIDQTLNLEWELGKFKDYWLSTRKKPPKDGVAAFRNWLRKACEYQQQSRGKNEQYHHKQNKGNSGLDNFLLGAAKLAAKFEGY